MKTILITNRKGGVGKTTTTVNLAASLGILGLRVVVIDLDTQSHAQYGFGFKEPFSKGIHNAIRKKKKLNKIVHKTEYENVSLIPADINFDISQIGQDDKQLAKSIEKSKLEDSFDVCIIDTPPTSDVLLLSALAISDVAIVPLKTEFLGAIGVNQFLKLFYASASKINPELELLGILPTMYNASMQEHTRIIEDAIQKVGRKRVLAPIRNDIKLSVAFMEGKPIAYLDARCRGSRDYNNLAVTVIEKLQL